MTRGDATSVKVSVWAPRARATRSTSSPAGGGWPSPAASGGSGPATCPFSRRATTTPSRSTAAPRGPTPGRRTSPSASRARPGSVDHAAFPWTDEGWTGVDLATAVLYELHVGTFSTEGTFDGAVAHLDHLVALGVTAVELLPVVEFPGRRGLGLRRGRPVGAPPRLRRTRRAEAAGRRLPRPRPRRRARRRLQPPRPGGELPRRARPVLRRPPPDELGPGPERRRAGQRRGAGLRRRQRPHVAAGLPPRRPAARCGARHRRRLGHPRPRAARHVGPRPGGRAGAAACGCCPSPT